MNLRGARVSEIEAQADAFVARADVVALDPVAGEPRYTTRELLRAERELLDASIGRRGRQVAVAEEFAVAVAIDARPTLGDEQRRLVSALTRSGDGVDVVRAAAGTGKTFGLDAAREAWQASGVPVLGCALSARAACELRDQAGVDAVTIARLRHALDRGIALAPGSVLIVGRGRHGRHEGPCRAHRCRDPRTGQARARRRRSPAARDRRRWRLPSARRAPRRRRAARGPPTARALGPRCTRRAAPRRRTTLRRDLPRPWPPIRRSDHGRRPRDAHARLVARSRGRRAGADDRPPARGRGRPQPARPRGPARGRAPRPGRPSHRGARLRGRRSRRRDPQRPAAHRRQRTDRHAGGGPPRQAARRARRRPPRRPARRLRPRRTRPRLRDDRAPRPGATVDRAFVLGSDELYREWGYAALTRHRHEARFYVTAAPGFLNQTPEPLRDGDVPLHVARMLADSRAEHLAMDSVGRSHDAGIGLGLRRPSPTSRPRPAA